MGRHREDIDMTPHNHTAKIAGYGAVFNTPDLNGDIIAPGAFTASLRKRAPVRMLYQHDAAAPIGRWVSLREDQYGLFVQGEILLASPRAREVHALLAGGALDGLSIGYQTVRAQKKTGSGRHIRQADLWEVSIVTFPMAQTARITLVGAAQIDPIVKTSRAGGGVPFGQNPLPGQRALVSPPASVRIFTTGLRQAANILSV